MTHMGSENREVAAKWALMFGNLPCNACRQRLHDLHSDNGLSNLVALDMILYKPKVGGTT